MVRSRKYFVEIGGSGVHFPLHMGETPTQSTEEQRQQPVYPTVYEDRKPKSIEDTEKNRR